MAYLRVLFIYYLISTHASDDLPSLVGHVYNQMNYNATGSSLAHLFITNKFLCAAQCANQYFNCNTAVFDSLNIPQCQLYSEVVLPGHLLISNTTVVYDFQQAKPKIRIPTISWNATGITVAGSSAGVAGVTPDLLSYTYGLGLDSSNSLYVADYGNNRIQKWLINASNGTTAAGMSNGTAGASSVALNGPVAIIFDSNDNMYFTDRNNARVVYWPKGASSGTTIAGVTGSAGAGNNLLFGPSAIALDWSSNTLYIADAYNHRVMRYLANATSGTVVAGGNGPGMNDTQLWFPYGLAFDPSSNSLLITNFNSHNIVRWVVGASNWTLVAGITGVFGSTSTLLSQPIGLAIDSAGNLYVADSGNHRIQFFLAGQSNGTTVAGITGTSGVDPNQLNGPFWAVVDSQRNIYVSDNNNNRVQMFPNY